jgi:hypothetical protein
MSDRGMTGSWPSKNGDSHWPAQRLADGDNPSPYSTLIQGVKLVRGVFGDPNVGPW